MTLWFQVHPELAEAARTRGPVVTVLPPLSPLRPFVFLQFNCGKKTVGKIIIELFDDIVPTAAKYFLSRCLSSSAAHPEDCLVGKQVTKVLHGVCFVCTISKSQDVGGARLTSKSEPSLRHCESGVVSVRCDGNDVCIALAATLPQYDATHQVIGRVIPICMSVVETIADVPTTADDVPAQAVIISRTGKTDAHGEAEIDVVDVDKKTPDDVGRVLKSENVQRSVL